MKRIVFFGIGLSVLLFTGCGGSGSSIPSDTTPEQQPTSQTPSGPQSCTVSGNTVLVDEGTTCTDQGHTLECKNNVVTYDGMLHAPTITINGRTYICQ